MKKVFALFIIFTLISSSAFAFDELITGAHPFVNAPGNLTSGGRLVYLTASDMLDADGEKQALADDTSSFRVPLYFDCGVMENLSAIAVVPIVSMDMGGQSETGIGDVWLGAKYNVLGKFTVRGALNLGTGDDKKGLGNPGGMGLDIAAMKRKTLIEDKFGIGGQVGIRWSGEDSDTKLQPGMGVYATGGAGYNLREGTSVSGELELMTFGDSSFDGADVTDSAVLNLDLNLSLQQRITERTGIYCTVVYTVMGENTLANTGFFLRTWYSFGKVF
jgi:hypothetical protein